MKTLFAAFILAFSLSSFAVDCAGLTESNDRTTGKQPASEISTSSSVESVLQD
jgi:hypothetical protein